MKRTIQLLVLVVLAVVAPTAPSGAASGDALPEMPQDQVAQQASLSAAATEECNYDFCTTDGVVQWTWVGGSPDCEWTITISWGDGKTDPFAYQLPETTYTHTYADYGVYTASATVTGVPLDPEIPECGSNTGTRTFQYTPDLQVTPSFTTVRTSVAEDGTQETWQFDASTTTVDPQDADLTFRWDFGDGTTGSGEQVSHTYDRSGALETYTVRLTVTAELSGAVEEMSVDKEITVEPVELSVTPGFNSSPVSSEGGSETWQFDASSTEVTPADANRSYSWDFGDGTTGSGEQVSHTFERSCDESPERLITLTVHADLLQFKKTGVATRTILLEECEEVTASTEWWQIGVSAPTLRDARALEPNGPRWATNEGDTFMFLFSTPMQSGIARQATVSLSDADGTLVELDCGSAYVECLTNRRPVRVGYLGNIQVAAHRLLSIKVNDLRAISQGTDVAGEIEGLSLGAWVVSFGSAVRTRGGAAISLPSSPDTYAESDVESRNPLR